MRHNKLLTLTALICAMLMSAQSAFAGKTKVFTEPRWLGANTKTVSITKVEFTDTATIVSFHLKSTPDHWVRIANDSYLVGENIAKKYMVIRGEGIVIGEQHTTPESGEDDFQVLFEPMPKNTRAFDFIEGDNPEGFRILGVHDRTKPIKIKTPKKAFQMTQELETEFFKEDTVHVRGRIEGYSRELGFSTVSFAKRNTMTSENKSLTVYINEDGTFAFSYMGYHPKEEFLMIKSDNIYAVAGFYTIPGQTTEFVTTLDGVVSYTKMPEGTFARQNSLLHDFSDICRYKSSEDDRAASASFMDYTKAAAMKMEESLKLTDYISLKYDYTPWERHLAHCLTRSDYTFSILSTELREHHKPHSDCSRFFFMRQLPYNDPSILVDGDVYFTINYYGTSNVIRNAYPRSFNDISSILHRDTVITKVDKQVMGEDKVSLLGEMLILTKYYAELNTSGWSHEGLKSHYDIRHTMLTHPALLRQLERIYQEADRRIDILTTLPNTDAAIAFRKITNKYKGKYVMVDFWGMNCGPCRQGIRNSVEMRKELRNNPDIEFVFINAVESNRQPYKEFTEKYLDGAEVYEVSTDEYNMFMELFEFSAIPHYELLDREGRIINKSIEYTHTAKEFLQHYITSLKEQFDQ